MSALFGGDSRLSGEESILLVPTSKIEPRSDQPRSSFGEAGLRELADSISSHGIIQPLTVRRLDSGYYQIIAGERRWRAARMAGLVEVPVRVLTADDRRVAELALVENLQRENLNPVEEAQGFRALIEEYGLTQEEAAKSVGKSRPAVANALRLLSLSVEVLTLVESGELSAGHARALLRIKEPSSQLAAAREVIKRGLSVRQTERLTDRLEVSKKPENKAIYEETVDYFAEVESQLSQILGRRVSIRHRAERGKIELDYYDSDDFENLINGLAGLGNK